MSSDKKDLTRIEDLGEFIHDLSADEDIASDLPDIPEVGDNLMPFDQSFDSPPALEKSIEGGLDFSTTEEFQTSSFEGSTSDFTTTLETPSETEESSSLGADEFSVSDFVSDSSEQEETSSPQEFQIPEKQESTDFFTTTEAPSSWNTDIPLTRELEEKSDSEAVNVADSLRAPLLEAYKAPEDFEDLKKFSESSSFTGMATEGNPSFSVLLKNVRYLEDIQDIVTMLKELSLLVDSEEQTKSRLMRGVLLIPRISEYAAVLLAHKLRRFDIDILVGLSDEIHPPKHQETPETGIVSRYSLYQNQTHAFHFDHPKLDLSQIILSATSQLDGYQVVKYLGVASEHKMLEGHVVEDENSEEVPVHYQELAQKLKAHALKAHSNAVVGLNYQLTPLPGEFGLGGTKYRLTCTGNLVWVNKL